MILKFSILSTPCDMCQLTLVDVILRSIKELKFKLKGVLLIFEKNNN
ncbi:hypothetical protein [Oceanirhabdus sp. W0125-5]|nr:hypothetical protein [Oceanirhabdus sp. W0125-5]WBW97674.1 hypothetical protein OW730_02530 [Oceanirhabdus sp. W0125-5]